jgi:hypothetical protein
MKLRKWRGSCLQIGSNADLPFARNPRAPWQGQCHASCITARRSRWDVDRALSRDSRLHHPPAGPRRRFLPAKPVRYAGRAKLGEGILFMDPK